MAFAVQVADVTLLAAGLVGLAAVLTTLLRRGFWWNPLANVPIPRGGPNLVGVAAVVFAFIVVQYSATSLLGGGPPGGTEPQPGSDAWHRNHAAGMAASVVMAGLMIGLLTAVRTPGARLPIGPWGGLAAGILGWLIVLPVTTIQAEMGRVVWQWVRPDAAPPVHVVLQALAESEWGVWGTVQLVLGAVLVAPLTEELFFRGVVLQAACYHFGRAWPAIVVSAIAFGLAHAQPQDVLPLISMGVVLGYLRLRCAALWPCVLLHVLFNARTMTFVLLAPELLHATTGGGA